MIPFGLTEQQFSDRYRGILVRVEKPTIREMRRVLALPVPEDVLSAEVVIFLDDSGYGAPAVRMSFAGKNTRVSKTDHSIHSGGGVEFEFDLSALENFDEQYYTSDFNGLGLAADVMRQWVAECWWKAGGWDYRIPVLLSVHDGWGNGKLVSLSESDA